MSHTASKLDPQHEVVMSEIAKCVKDGECILFLGSGIHAPSPPTSDYQYGEPDCPPLAAALARLLAEKICFSDRLPVEISPTLQRAALGYEVWGDRYQLIKEVRGAVQEGKKPSPLLILLASLPFRLVITTNYDKLFEDALLLAGKSPTVKFYKPNRSESDEPNDYPPGQLIPTPTHPFLFKIHGDIDDPKSVVITDDDYTKFVLRMTCYGQADPIPKLMQLCLSKWPILFLGYSLLDYDLRLLFQLLRWKLDPSWMPPSFSVDRQPDPLVLEVLQNQRRYLKYIVQDVWAFVPDLIRRV